MYYGIGGPARTSAKSNVDDDVFEKIIYYAIRYPFNQSSFLHFFPSPFVAVACQKKVSMIIQYYTKLVWQYLVD